MEHSSTRRSRSMRRLAERELGPRAPGRRRPPFMGVVAIGALLILAIVVLGRGTDGISGIMGQFGASVRPSASGKQVLEQLCARYQAIKSYEDRTLMRLKFPVADRWHEEVVDALVRFVRPNSVRLHVNLPTIQLLVTSDGKQLTSRILDEGNKQLDQQLVQHAAPEELSLQSLFSATEIVSTEGAQQLQSILMNLPCPLSVSQMSLLFDVQYVKQLIESSDRIERLPDRALGGHLCARVELSSPAGRFLFWVDDQQGLLRRIEYPNSAPRAEMSSTDAKPDTSNFVMLSVDYDNVRVDAAFPPGGFRQQPPPGAAFVRHFVVPPVRDTANVLGRRVSNYWFTDLAGGQLHSADLKEAVNVLVWFNNRAPSRAVLEHLNKIHQTRPESVKIVGICTEPTTAMSHEDIRQLRADWQLEFPVVRDLQAFGRDVFGVNQAPTLVAIDGHGTVQLFEVGGSSEMYEQLPIVFNKIKAGEPLAKQYLDYLDQQAEEYRKLLAAASISATDGRPQVGTSRHPVSPAPAVSTSPTASVSTSRQPAGELTLGREWSLQLGETELRQVRVVETDREPLILVAGQEPVIHEVSVTGQRRESFPLIDIRGPSDLRLFAPSPRASVFATFSERGPVSVFDHRWISRFSYPNVNSLRTEVKDALVNDLDANGEPELYVALGDRELHCVDAMGKLAWSLDDFRQLRSLAVSHDQSGQKFLLVAHDDDRITPLSAAGDRHESLQLNIPILRLLASPRQADDGAFCVVSGSPLDGMLVLVLDASFRETWRRELPADQLNDQAHSVHWAPWQAAGKQGFWLIHGVADELLIVSEDGTIAKSLTMRFPLTCVAGTVYNNRNYLLGTSASTLMAWQIELNDQASR